jgi:hypothetical protein
MNEICINARYGTHKEIEFIYIPQIVWVKPKDAVDVIIKYKTHFVQTEVQGWTQLQHKITDVQAVYTVYRDTIQ